MKKSNAEKHGETLSLKDFFALAEEMGMKYITNATMYTANGSSCVTSLNKAKNKKWQQLKKEWKSK